MSPRTFKSIFLQFNPHKEGGPERVDHASHVEELICSFLIIFLNCLKLILFDNADVPFTLLDFLTLYFFGPSIKTEFPTRIYKITEVSVNFFIRDYFITHPCHSYLQFYLLTLLVFPGPLSLLHRIFLLISMF